MRGHLRACRRPLERESGLGLVAILTVACLFLAVDALFGPLSGFTVRPGEHLLNVWLLLTLGLGHVVWTILRSRGRIDAAGEIGFVLAAFGLCARYWVHVFLYCGLSECYSEFSIIEQTADTRLRLLIAAHRWGGLLAVVIGVAAVVRLSARPTGIRGTAGNARPAPHPSGTAP